MMKTLMIRNIKIRDNERSTSEDITFSVAKCSLNHKTDVFTHQFFSHYNGSTAESNTNRKFIKGYRSDLRNALAPLTVTFFPAFLGRRINVHPSGAAQKLFAPSRFRVVAVFFVPLTTWFIQYGQFTLVTHETWHGQEKRTKGRHLNVHILILV